jgi:uracil permease
MLIAFSLLPYLVPSLAGIDDERQNGQLWVLLSSLGLTVIVAAFSHWLPGIWKTVAVLLGMFVGTAYFFILDFPGWQNFSAANWVSAPGPLVASIPGFEWPVLVAFSASYLAVVVNSLGSLHGIAAVTDRERLPRAISRGILFNGAAGICCGLMGIVGMVSYSISPGVVLANRVASRHATACCGVILMLAALVPKLAALLAMVPAPVVAAALCVAMGAQIGSALDAVSSGGMSRRDYFVVGLPVLLGTLVGFLPPGLLKQAPFAFRVFIGNGLILGILIVLLLEHIVMRTRKPSKSEA